MCYNVYVSQSDLYFHKKVVFMDFENFMLGFLPSHLSIDIDSEPVEVLRYIKSKGLSQTLIFLMTIYL